MNIIKTGYSNLRSVVFTEASVGHYLSKKFKDLQNERLESLELQ